jgi:aminoglycoside 2''-phosphotransferase
VEIRQKVEDKVYPLLMVHQVEWARHLFDGILADRSNFDYKPCLVHGDLGPYHILFDRRTSRIKGIIDFGVSGVGDPAIDFGNLLQVYGESFVSRLRRQYPESEHLMKRVRFYAQAIELERVLSGITSGETLWFLAHIGGARDIQQ